MNTKWDILVCAFKRGLGYGAGLGALYGTFIVPIIGTLEGLLIGAIAGIVGGIVCGIAIGQVTGLFFKPIVNPRHYQWIIISMSALIAVATTALTLLAFYGPDAFLSPGIFHIPILIAAVAAGYAAYGFSKRWIAGHKPTNSIPVVPHKSISIGNLS